MSIPGVFSEPVRVGGNDGVVVLTVSGCLDADTGAALLAAADAAVDSAVTRLDIDLRELESFSPEGARALVDCRRQTDSLAEGLHYRTGRGPGREALLAAYADQPIGQ